MTNDRAPRRLDLNRSSTLNTKNGKPAANRLTGSLAGSLALGLAASLFSAPAVAATGLHSLNVSRQRVDEALLDLALQTRSSLGGDIGACRGFNPAVRGVMTLDAALTQILAGSGCTHTIRPDGAVIIRRAAVRPTPLPTPAAHPVAPPPQDLQTSQLSDVIVTAGRRAESPQRSASAVSALSAGQIASSNIADINDLGSFVAGMTVTNLGPGRNKVLLRGMSDGAFTGLTQSTVALYLDLAPITYSAPDPDLKLIDVDRVEVLRGPQGTLYGTGSIGGVLRIVTRRPDLNRPFAQVSLTNSLTRSGGPNSDYSATINQPFWGGRAAVRATVYQEAFGGYVNDVSLNLRRVNDGSREGGRLSLTTRLAPEWSLTAGLVHQSIDTEDTHYIYRTLGGLTRANLIREPHDNKFDQDYLTLEGRGDWGRFDGSIARIQHRFATRYDASSALRSFGSAYRLGALDEFKEIELLVAEATLTSPDTGRLRWLAGGSFSTSSTRTDTALSEVRTNPIVVYSEARKDHLDEVTLFGEASYDLTPKLILTAGARYYSFNYRTVSDVIQGHNNRSFDGSGNASGITPKLALAYHVNDALNLYALVSQGHRTGGFNTAGPANQGFTGARGGPERQYRPDTLWNYEAGAKASLLDGRVHTRVAVFIADWQNIQSDQFLPSGLAYAVNVGDGANKGLEVEANWRPTEHLEIRGTALFANPTITHPSPNFNARRDAGLPGVPKASGNLTAAYTRSIPFNMDVFADANLAYVGASRLTFDAQKRYRMGDYITGRVSAGVSRGPWSAMAFVDNPLDTKANTFSFSDPFRLPEALAVTPLRPRTIGLTLRWTR